MKSIDDADLIVLGAGVIGLSTALVMQSLGWKTAIIAQYFPRQADPYGCSAFVASDYAMASAYPHHLQVRNLNKISDDSQAVFAAIHESAASGPSGLEIYKIYEVFEKEPPAAALASRRRNFRSFDGSPSLLARSYELPARPSARYLWGWQFESYFADMPVYLSNLWQRFISKGGLFQERRIESLAGQVSEFKGRIIINCLGLGAIEAAQDSSACNIMRGRQILVCGKELLKDEEGRPLAYNYTPDLPGFCRANGEAEYLHFFPRSDGWLLGQTRESGSLDPEGNWQGAEVKAKELEIDGRRCPEPILSLNREILQNWRSACLGSEENLKIREGLRYYRDPSGSGVRLESEESDSCIIVHNYGHGGSGVTMSWGTAIESARLLKEHFPGKRNSEALQSKFDLEIQELLFA